MDTTVDHFTPLALRVQGNNERAARLERLSANEHLRLAAETNSEKANGFDLDLIWIEIRDFKNKFFQGMSSLAL